MLIRGQLDRSTKTCCPRTLFKVKKKQQLGRFPISLTFQSQIADLERKIIQLIRSVAVSQHSLRAFATTVPVSTCVCVCVHEIVYAALSCFLI